MAHVRFDLHKLFESIDHERQRRGASWAAVAREVGVAASTVRRFGDANDAEADGVLALVRWLGVAPETFVVGHDGPSATLVTAGHGVVRVNMEAVAAAAGDSRGAGGRTRTTIQHLVSAAQHAGVTIASLTRLSDA